MTPELEKEFDHQFVAHYITGGENVEMFISSVSPIVMVILGAIGILSWQLAFLTT